MNGFGFDNNCCLWILIILLILCACKSGVLNGLLNGSCCLPIALLLVCCLCKNGGANFFNLGCK